MIIPVRYRGLRCILLGWPEIADGGRQDGQIEIGTHAIV